MCPMVPSVLHATLVDVEGVLEYFNVWYCPTEGNDHDIETAGGLGEPVTGKEVEGHGRDAAALEGCDRLGPSAKLAAVPRLDLDEHDGPAIARDDVNFSTTATIAAGNNLVPPPFEFGTGEIFSGFSKDLSRIRHDPRLKQDAGLNPRLLYFRFQRVPVPESSRTMPRSARRSRIRSLSAKSRRRRAA